MSIRNAEVIRNQYEMKVIRAENTYASQVEKQYQLHFSPIERAEQILLKA
jgi:hypothetical protein